MKVISRPALAALGAAALVAGCGGGAYISFGNGDDDPFFPDRGVRPAIALSASPGSAPRGGTVQLAASASDDRGIDRVEFYRVDGGGRTNLGSDASAPYDWNAAIPADAAGSVQFGARAVDVDGNAADSAPVTISVRD